MYDFSMTGKAQLLALINESAGLSLTDAQITFDFPLENTTVEGANTEVKITGVHNGGFKGTTTIRYNRIDLSEFMNFSDDNVLQIEGEPTTLKILDAFNTNFRCQLLEDDLDLTFTVPVSVDGGVAMTLVANTLSLAYRGTIDVLVQPADVELDTVILEPMMDGLYLQDPEAVPAP